MAEIWFSSDLHLGHANIIKYCNRPFADPNEQDEKLIEIHNSYVRPEDKWYNLGDVTMERGNKAGPLLDKIKLFNGHKRLIPGNHDHYSAEIYLTVFEKVMAMQFLDNIRFTHIPIHPNSMGSCVANVHGHTHNQANYDPVIRTIAKGRLQYQPYINISIERTDYRPVTLSEIKDLINKAKGEYEAYQTALKDLNGKSPTV